MDNNEINSTIYTPEYNMPPTKNPTLTNKLINRQTPTLDVHELSELLLNENQPWQVHNCKLLKLQCSNHGKLPFLYHYDQLSNHLKHEYPLTGKLLNSFNTPMTAKEACELIGISSDNIPKPKFVKITGTIVVFLDILQLAVRLHWSNTIKPEDAIYCKENKQAISQALDRWIFLGRVDTLYRSTQPILTVYDELPSSANNEYIIPFTTSYQMMPASFAICLLEKLHKEINKLKWVDQAIRIHVN